MSQETGHTPGPWSYEYYTTTGTYIVDGPHGPVASIGERTNWPQRAERSAQLIAAAPELLEAARKVVKAWDLGDAHFEIDRDLRDAINKAEGRRSAKA